MRQKQERWKHVWKRVGILTSLASLCLCWSLWHRTATAGGDDFALPGDERPKPKPRKRANNQKRRYRGLSPIYGPPKEWQSFRSTSQLTCAIQDSDNIWAGTNNSGVIRWSIRSRGYRFYVPKAKNSNAQRITSLALDRQGNLWVGTKGYGVGMVKDGTRRFKWYQYKNGLPSNDIRGLVRDNNGNIWAATPRGVARWNGKRWKKFTRRQGLPDGDIRAVGLDSQGNVWFSPNISNPFYYNGRRFKRLKKFPFTGSTCAVSDRTGGMWFCNEQGAIHYTSENTRSYNTTHGMAGPIVQSIYVDAGGGVWFGTKDNGISYLRNRRWSTINRRQGLPGTDIRALMGGPGGTILAATYLNGIAMYQNRRWNRLGIGIVGNKIYAISHGPDGAAWIGTSSGASRYHNGYWYNYANELTTPDVRSFTFDPTNSAWIGTFGAGAYRHKGRNWKAFDVLAGIASNNVVGAHLTPEGLWFVHEQKGASLYNGESWKTYNERNTLGLLDPAYPVQATHLDKDLTLYIGFKGGGVIKRPLRGRWQRIGYMSGAGGRGVVNGISSDNKGNLWFATKVGLFRMKGGTFKHFTKRDGLPDKNVLAVATEGHKIWIGTKKGVACYDGTSWRSFNHEMGLVSDEITVISVSPTGEKWFGSPASGLTIYRGE
ncbi:MAG: hypothetical protein H6727_03320 [Myxococcales bacterium]|nr:hypothetical protein [Myxococcales bacterium]